MTNQDQDLTKLRIRVAELCPSLFLIRRGTFTPKMTYWNDEGRQGAAVDPTSNLNACHEFEKTLTIKQQRTYNDALYALANCDCPTESQQFAMCHADALSRCRAFVALHDADSGGKSNE